MGNRQTYMFGFGQDLLMEFWMINAYVSNLSQHAFYSLVSQRGGLGAIFNTHFYLYAITHFASVFYCLADGFKDLRNS